MVLQHLLSGLCSPAVLAFARQGPCCQLMRVTTQAPRSASASGAALTSNGLGLQPRVAI